MNLAAHFGAFFLAPFIFASSFFGGHATVNHAPLHASSTITASTTRDDDGDADKDSSHPDNWGGIVSSWRHWLNDQRHSTTTATSTPATTTPSLSSIAPASGPIGTVVTLTGTGFTSDALVHFGPGVIRDATVNSSTTITFTVPSSIGPYCPPGKPCPMYMARITTPGTYNVSVTEKNGTTNVEKFYVSSTTQNAPIVSVNGITGPASLVAGTEGTWTINASTTATTSLSYSVNWGDQGIFQALAASVNPTIQSSATFTHTYDHAGTYHPTFTVSDGNGHHASVSETVVVTAS